MPIPPRPIPVHSRQTHRQPCAKPPTSSTATANTSKPGNAVPRKSLSTLSTSLDWRAEVALLGDRSKSVPVNELSGVKLISPSQRAGLIAAGGSSGGPRGKAVEVGVGELIEGSKGKREKRATTATTLGFDFIPNHSVLVLPDLDMRKPAPIHKSGKPSIPPPSITATSVSAPAPVVQNETETPEPRRASLLSRSPFGFSFLRYTTPAPATTTTTTAQVGQVIKSSEPSPAADELDNTPSTPGLIPAQVGPLDKDVEEEDDDEWERVSEAEIMDTAAVPKGITDNEGERRVEEEDDEGELIVVGELELDDEPEAKRDSKVKVHGHPGLATGTGLVGRGGHGSRISYAAAVSA